MKNVVVVFPQERDTRLARSERHRIRFVGSDLDAHEWDAPLRVDVVAGAHGIVGTKDRSALIAAILAEQAGLPGPSPDAVVACQHKPTSRAIQRRVAPEHTPRFAVLDEPPSFPPPWFVKPVVGRLSQEARRVDSANELAALVEEPQYRDAYAELAAVAGLPAAAVRGFLVEELVDGDEVTLEGYVHHGETTVIGATDSVKYPGTNSFMRFEYPSALSPDRLRELRGLAERIVSAHGLDDCFFNVELLVPEDGPAHIVEVNARIASQFAPLVAAVHGRSTYDALFDVACGDDPMWAPEGSSGVAISYVVRVFEDATVLAVPAPEPGLEVLVQPGLRLSAQGTNDAASFRLAIFTEHAATREQAVSRCVQRAGALRFELEAVAADRDR